MTSAPFTPSRRQVLIAGGLAGGALAAGAAFGLHGMPAGERAGIAFGTTVKLKAVHSDQRVLNAALDAAWGEIAAVEEAASLFRPDSALSILNRDGALADPPRALAEMIAAAQELSLLSDGAFDITVQPLWNLYAACHAAGREASPEEFEAVRALVGYQMIHIEPARISLARRGMALTLNGIAQGYATQRCLQVLAGHGVTDAFLDTGEIGVSGTRDGHNQWTAAIADPRRPGAFIALTRPLAGVLATSGDYATTFSADFAQNHIFDPRTLRSPAALASVSVLAQSGALADGLATAMMVLGPEKSLALAKRLAGVEVFLVTKSGERLATDGFPLA